METDSDGNETPKTEPFTDDFDEFIKNNDKPVLNDRDIELYRIAALIHDIGHGPYSHLYDDNIVKNGVHHEERGIKIFKQMVKRYNLSLTQEEEKTIINKSYLPCPSCSNGKLYLKKPKRINGYAWNCSLEPYCIGKAKFCVSCKKYPAVNGNRCIDPQCETDRIL